MDELRVVWAVPTVDSTGKRVHLFVGEIEYDGRTELGVRIDAGQIAIVPLPFVVGSFLAAVRQTSESAWRKNAEDDR